MVVNSSNLGPHPKYGSSVRAGIPRLQHKEGFDQIRIGDLFDEIQRPIKMVDDEEYSLVTVKRNRGGVEKREILQGKQIAVKSQFEVKEGDFLISKRQIVHGACGFVPKELDGSIVSNEYSVLRCKDNLNPSYLLYLIHSPYFQQTCFHSSVGVVVEKMIFKLEDWFKWKINIPLPDEQQKIASFLESVDQKLNKLKEKKDLLDTYKKGVIQKIFSQEIRYKQDDGTDFPDWEEKKLGNIGKFQSGIGFAEREQGGKQGIPFYKVSDMNLTGNESVMRFSNNYVTNDQIYRNKYKTIIEKSFIFAKVGAAIFLERKREASNFLIDNNMMSFSPYPEFDFSFIGVLLRKIRLSKYAQVGALPSYNASDLKTIRVEIPSYREQQKIADFLTSIDKKIDFVSQQISQIEDFKKGLLQKMFV